MRELIQKPLLILALVVMTTGWSSTAFGQSGCTPEAMQRIRSIQEEVLQVSIAMAQGRISINQAMQYAQQLQQEAGQLQAQCPGAFAPRHGGNQYGGSGGYEGGSILRDGDTLYAPSEGLACDSTGCYGP